MSDTKDKPISQEDIKQALESSGRSLEDVAKKIRIAPSKRTIFQMPKDILLKHNALVFHKASSLSSTQRKLVQERVAYGLSRDVIKPEEVAMEINKLNALIQGELVKAIKNDDSVVEQSDESAEEDK